MANYLKSLARKMKMELNLKMSEVPVTYIPKPPYKIPKYYLKHSLSIA